MPWERPKKQQKDQKKKKKSLKNKVRLLNFMRVKIMTIANKCAVFKVVKSMVGQKRSLHTWFSIVETFFS